MDDFMALIGAAPTEEDKQRQIANLLRRRRAFGEIGMASGDRALAPLGENMMNQTSRYAGQLQQTRQAGIDDQRMQDQLAEQIRHNKAMEALGFAGIEGEKEEARIRAEARANPPRKMTDSTRNKISDTVSAFDGTSALLSTFKDDYVQQFGAGPQSLLPNTLSRWGMGSKDMDEAQLWWAGWNEIRTLPQRNQLFGATLTANEKAEWDKVDINPTMKPEQIRNGIQRIQGILRRVAQRHARVMVADHYDPEQLITAYGEDILTNPPEGTPGSAAGEGDELVQQIEELQRQIQEQQEGLNGNP